MRFRTGRMITVLSGTCACCFQSFKLLVSHRFRASIPIIFSFHVTDLNVRLLNFLFVLENIRQISAVSAITDTLSVAVSRRDELKPRRRHVTHVSTAHSGAYMKGC
jgi:hypothetical protein